ncbi:MULTISPECIES: hypothetical protein [Tissierellales]|jgi:hypothetical protein|uniref:Uncharacterized protein n=1 Tax=Acidilutibacter cellobiosedens TaxID=2507161 RepID=A0A410QB71_9FIRM|nr:MULTISPECIES: hypothetical protein [Tissierellales]QAT61246.1 hypothetical protein EQM13_06410 [Acidilutibacter cellobiosedens]SCL96152.1 hypothetical protein PP176A_3031 [Sporanaerobacter sp. PP17-6a]
MTYESKLKKTKVSISPMACTDCGNICSSGCGNKCRDGCATFCADLCKIDVGIQAMNDLEK